MFVAHRCVDFRMDGRCHPRSDGVVTNWGTDQWPAGLCVQPEDFTVFGGSVSARPMPRRFARSWTWPCRMRAGDQAERFRRRADRGGRGGLAGYADVFQRNIMASGVVPQIRVIMGPCAGGAVYRPAMTDFIFMVRDSYMFVTGPDVVKTVTNEVVTAEELRGEDAYEQELGRGWCLRERSGHADRGAAPDGFPAANNSREKPPVRPFFDDRRIAWRPVSTR